MSITDKDAELKKYRELVIATLDYYIEREEYSKNPAFQNLSRHFLELRSQTEELFQKGRLSTLKKWFRDLTEISVEARDLKFNEYLKNKTKYDIDIFKSFKNRIEKIIKDGRI
ncbi:MAG: hypothetical protein SCALA702_00490 [Melioribacteraceae bacterium]|nr:MAG: hypothetical protein SCALA702_00490 [Melioribacteraceae bacterium]